MLFTICTINAGVYISVKESERKNHHEFSLRQCLSDTLQTLNAASHHFLWMRFYTKMKNPLIAIPTGIIGASAITYQTNEFCAKGLKTRHKESIQIAGFICALMAYVCDEAYHESLR